MARPSIHNQSNTPEYRAWTNMKYRCNTPSCNLYPYYGGRGITVCDEWQQSFAAFLKHIGPRPSPRHSLDRIDNNGDYRPGNVRWATRYQQCRNRRSSRLLTIGGRTMSAIEWAEAVNLPIRTLRSRLRLNWSLEYILSPVRAA